MGIENYIIAFLISWLSASIRMSTSIIFGTIGELYHEKVGVLNLGIEGQMIIGALVGFLVTKTTGNNLWLGVVAGGISGSLISLILAFFAVSLGLNQHVTGLGLTFFCTGLSYFIYRIEIGFPKVHPTIESFSTISVPIFSKIPLLGSILFQQCSLVYVAFVIVALSSFILYRTSWGLRIRTVGENPTAADTAGINVFKVRYLSLIWGGFLIGLGGSFMSLAIFNSFIFGLTAGRGWICLALVVLGKWKPWSCLIAALFFGTIDAFQLRLQALNINLPYQLLLVLPYVATIIALILASKQAMSPASLLKPYRREE